MMQLNEVAAALITVAIDAPWYVMSHQWLETQAGKYFRVVSEFRVANEIAKHINEIMNSHFGGISLCHKLGLLEADGKCGDSYGLPCMP